MVFSDYTQPFDVKRKLISMTKAMTYATKWAFNGFKKMQKKTWVLRTKENKRKRLSLSFSK